MNLIGRLVVVGALSLGVIASAEATCTKPSGTYAGIFSGSQYGASGGIINVFATELTVVISATGSGTETEVGKKYFTGVVQRYTSSTSFTAAQNVFNSTTCQGIVTTASGQVFIYASVNSGGEIRLTDYTDNGTIFAGVGLLQKL